MRLGVPAAEGADGVASVKFGVLFNDDDVGNYFEALNGTLRAAKRLKIVDFEVRARARVPTRRVRAATYRPLAGALARAPLTRPNAPTFPTLCPPSPMRAALAFVLPCRARCCFRARTMTWTLFFSNILPRRTSRHSPRALPLSL